MKIFRVYSKYRIFLIKKVSYFQHEGIGVLAKALAEIVDVGLSLHDNLHIEYFLDLIWQY